MPDWSGHRFKVGVPYEGNVRERAIEITEMNLILEVYGPKNQGPLKTVNESFNRPDEIMLN